MWAVSVWHAAYWGGTGNTVVGQRATCRALDQGGSIGQELKTERSLDREQQVEQQIGQGVTFTEGMGLICHMFATKVDPCCPKGFQYR